MVNIGTLLEKIKGKFLGQYIKKFGQNKSLMSIILLVKIKGTAISTIYNISSILFI